MNRLLVLPLLLVLGCAADPVEPGGELDGEFDDAGDGGKTDTGGIKPNTPQSYTVVMFANLATAKELKAAALGKTAIANILAVRAGDDGKEGTDDDGGFWKLEDLDAVPFVGPQAFKAMLKYAGDKVRYARPQIDGKWVLDVTLEGSLYFVFRSDFAITDFGYVTEALALGTVPVGASLPLDGMSVHTSYADHDQVWILAYPVGDRSHDEVMAISLDGNIRNGNLICGEAIVSLRSRGLVKAKFSATRMTDGWANLPDTSHICD